MSEDIRLPMACSCGPERTKIWDDLFKETAVKVGADPDDDWFNPFIYDIATYYNAEIRIIADQWMRVTVEPYGAPTISIDCDRVEHGIAALWLALRERYPDGYIPPDEDDEDDEDDDDDGD